MKYNHEEFGSLGRLTCRSLFLFPHPLLAKFRTWIPTGSLLLPFNLPPQSLGKRTRELHLVLNEICCPLSQQCNLIDYRPEEDSIVRSLIQRTTLGNNFSLPLDRLHFGKHTAGKNCKMRHRLYWLCFTLQCIGVRYY